MRLLTIFAAAFMLSTAAQSAPSVSNRNPNPDEVGYRPADAATSRLNPPSWIWLHETNAHTYRIEWSSEPDFKQAGRAEGFQWNTYTHNRPLTPGTWFWRYAFVTATGATSTWSKVRSVVVPKDAEPFAMPTRAEQRERVPAGHPRLFMRPEDLPRLKAAAAGNASGEFKKLLQAADRIIDAGPTPEPEHMGSARDKNNPELIKYWWPNRVQTEKACQEAETLSFVYLLERSPKYAAASRKWILHLASWDPDGPTNFKLNCEAGKPLLYRLPRAYDWAWDTLSESDRTRVREVMRRRVRDAWESGEVGRGTGHLNRPFNSHGNRIWHKIGEAGIAFLGEVPEAEMWLDYAVNKFHAIYPVWSDDDGGWHEGVSYWAGYMGKAVSWMQVSKSALQIDGFKKPFFAQVGDFPLYITPPGSPNMGFGDLSFRPPSPGWGPFLDYFIRAQGGNPASRAGYWRWWAGQWNMKPDSGIYGFINQGNLPPAPPARPPADLPTSKVFHGIGVASMHTSLLDSADDVHLLFKSSPFGTQSHGHNPHNTFQLNAYGENLLTTCGYRDLHGSKFHYQYVHSTMAHNGVLVNGEGQIKHTPAPHGRIVAEQFTPAWDYIVGDATAAYGGKLTRFRRHVALVKGTPAFVVLYDELAAPKPSTYQFMLHALSEFSISNDLSRLNVRQPKAAADIQYLGSLPVTFRQWDGFEPPPTKEFPNHWHVQASTRDHAQRLDMLTIIVPYKIGRQLPWTAEQVVEDETFGARFRFPDRKLTIRFPKYDSQATFTFE